MSYRLTALATRCFGLLVVAMVGATVAAPPRATAVSVVEKSIPASVPARQAERRSSSARATVVHSTKQPSIYFGVFAPVYYQDLAGLSSLSGVTAFERDAKKKVAIIQAYQHWADTENVFPALWMSAVRAHGSIPLLTWMSSAVSSGPRQPTYSSDAVTSGNYDAYVTQWAKDAKTWGHPFFLRFDHEMNAPTTAYADGVNGNPPGSFVTLWKHVHDIFAQQHVTNVTWVWCPTGATQFVKRSLKDLYPGDNYVDWTCLDVYNYGGSQTWSTWQPFSDTLTMAYQNVQSVAPKKPLMLGEFSSAEQGGSKAGWITDALTKQLPDKFPQVKALVWFNLNITSKYAKGPLLQPVDFRIESSDAAQRAFASAIGSSVYATNLYGKISASPIPAPDQLHS